MKMISRTVAVNCVLDKNPIQVGSCACFELFGHQHVSLAPWKSMIFFRQCPVAENDMRVEQFDMFS